MRFENVIGKVAITHFDATGQARLCLRETILQPKRCGLDGRRLGPRALTVPFLNADGNYLLSPIRRSAALRFGDNPTDQFVFTSNRQAPP
jgi:hypothetical protein